ncbi:TonB-dependent receptor [Sphingomonas sp. ASV193]|uniref:TonB-dependent receptor n=1 Tax=Sphingomonas sp. ASV193 TaxID=3144405 RepID=UPI0032E87808
MRDTTKQAVTACSILALAAPVSAQPAASRTEGQQIVITAPRAAKTARREQKDAPNLVNVQSAETIAKYPDYNAAEALGRVPGVSLSIDTGEGRFVNIRGLDGNLNGATYGGVVLLNTQAGGTYFNASGRAVEFDTVPIGAVDRIVVTKTGLPDNEAEGLGGSVELTPRTALGRDRPFLDLQLGGGYQNLRKTGLYRIDATVGGGLGTNADGRSLVSGVLNLFLHDDKRGIDDIEAAYSDSQPAIPDKAFNALELRRYQYHRRRFGATSEVDLTPSERQRLYFRASVAGYVERVNRQRLEIDGLDGSNGSGIITAAPGNTNGFFVPDASAVKTLRDEQETHRNLLLQLGGVHDLGMRGARFDWFAALARSTYNKPFDRNTTFSGPGDGDNPQSTFPISYDNTTDSNHPTYSSGQVDLANPANYILAGIRNSSEYDRDLERSVAANLTLPSILKAGDEFKIGAKLRFRHKLAETNSIRLSGGGQPFASCADNGTLLFYGGRYDIGPMINRDSIANAFGPAIALPPLGFADAEYNDREDVSAAYAEYRTEFGPLSFLGGARIEHTRAAYGGFVTTGDTTAYTEVKHGYTNVFPTIQLRYSLSPDVILRGTYSTALARPGFLQTIQNGTVDLGNQVITNGNPNLRPTYGNNFDVSLEAYLPDSGIASIGVFDKEFRNYIVARSFFAPYAPSGTTSPFLYQSFDNASGAYARGIEASLVDHFRWLPGVLSGLGVDANVTYVDSGVSLRAGEEKRLLPGTSPWTGNLALTYERGPIQLRLAGEYVDHTLFGVGSGPESDIYQESRATLDFFGDYDVSKKVSLYVTAKNLLNTPLKFYERSPNRPIQREYYLETFEAGVKIHL